MPLYMQLIVLYTTATKSQAKQVVLCRVLPRLLWIAMQQSCSLTTASAFSGMLRYELCMTTMILASMLLSLLTDKQAGMSKPCRVLPG